MWRQCAALNMMKWRLLFVCVCSHFAGPSGYFLLFLFPAMALCKEFCPDHSTSGPHIHTDLSFYHQIQCVYFGEPYFKNDVYSFFAVVLFYNIDLVLLKCTLFF
jgi:hypothetical protein